MISHSITGVIRIL